MGETDNPFEVVIEAIAERVARKIGSPGHSNDSERLLDAGEAATLLSVSEDWLYRNAKKLPFTRKLGPKMLRFSQEGIFKWLETRKLH